MEERSRLKAVRFVCPAELPAVLSRILILGLMLPLALVVLTSCAAGETSYRIGVVHPFTGDGVVDAIPVWVGIQKAVSDVNQRWSQENRHLELIVEDGQCTKKGGLAAARRLVEGSGVKIIYGGSCSYETLGMAAYAEENQVLLLTPLTGSGAGNFVFRNRASKAAQVRAMLPVLEAQGFRRFALLTSDTAFAQGFRSSYIELLPSIGGEIVADEVLVSGADIHTGIPSITSFGGWGLSGERFSEALTKFYRPRIFWPAGAGYVEAKASRVVAGAPDAVIVLPHTKADAWFLMSVLREAGFSGPGVVNDVVDVEESLVPSEPFWKFGEFWELMEGFYVPAFETYVEPDLAAMRKDDFCWSDGYCTVAYSGVLLMAEALRTCGEDDEDAPVCLRDFLTENPEWGGVSFGVLDSDKADSMEDYFRVSLVQEGEFVPVDLSRKQTEP